MHTAVQISGIETPRLFIREIRSRDSRQFSDYMLRADYQAAIAVRYTHSAEVENFVSRSVRRQKLPNRTSFHLAAVSKENGKIIGDGFITKHRPRSAELGWGVHPGYWQLGLGTEIGEALIAVGFEKLDCALLWAKSFAANTGSIRLMDRIGLSHDRLAPDQQVAPGVRTDVTYYSMKADDYFEAAY